MSSYLRDPSTPGIGSLLPSTASAATICSVVGIPPVLASTSNRPPLDNRLLIETKPDVHGVAAADQHAA